MENQETNINLGPEPVEKTVYVIFTEVDKLYLDKSTKVWYAHFLGSWESLAFGEEKPFEVGNRVKISFERIEDDQPIQPSE